MARADLSAILERLDDDSDAVQADSTGEAPTVALPKQKIAEQKSPRRQKSSTVPKDDPTTGVGPLYRRLERKETRLRADQYSKLTEHARRLNRAKDAKGERITENTLIRVAIDLLLEHVDELNGSNETELRNSVTL